MGYKYVWQKHVATCAGKFAKQIWCNATRCSKQIAQDSGQSDKRKQGWFALHFAIKHVC